MKEPGDDEQPVSGSSLLEPTERYLTDSIRIEEPDAAELCATLTVLQGPRLGAVHRLARGRNVVGRAADCQVRTALDGVSRRHALITGEGERYTLEDLGSTNGTLLGGVLVKGPVELQDGDRINLGGRVILRFAREGQLEEALRERMYELATRDPLTRAYNRRFFVDRMDSEWPWAVRHERASALLMIDIDHFKHINDTYGHPAGDRVLQQLVDVLHECIRREDLLARFGGEEFVVFCRTTGLEQGLRLAERLRAAVERECFEWKGARVAVTVSVGVCASTEMGIDTPADMFEKADAALYQAKRAGRNRVAPSFA